MTAAKTDLGLNTLLLLLCCCCFALLQLRRVPHKQPGVSFAGLGPPAATRLPFLLGDKGGVIICLCFFIPVLPTLSLLLPRCLLPSLLSPKCPR